MMPTNSPLALNHGAAGVARVDGRIRLDKGLGSAIEDHFTVQAADDAAGNAVGKQAVVRAADDKDRIAQP